MDDSKEGGKPTVKLKDIVLGGSWRDLLNVRYMMDSQGQYKRHIFHDRR